MDNTGKILLIIVVVLVAVLSLMVGLVLQAHSNENVSISNINNTTSNQITQNTSTKSNQSSIISSSEAKAIAKKWGASRGVEPDGYVSYLSGIGMYQGANGNPFYHVGLKWIDSNRTVQEYGDAGYIEIDAKTGAIVQR